MVEDDEDDYIVTRDLLDEVDCTHYEVEWVSSFENAMDITNEQRHDIFLFDYRLGAHSGMELLHACRNQCQHIPTILLTGQKNRELDMEAMQAGASDFLYKGEINSDLLERSIRYALKQGRAEKEIARLAFYDSLTGLPNRTLFKDRLEQALLKGARRGALTGLLFLDIDNFKQINDTLGHYAGDLLLKQVGDRLLSTVRKSDSMIRYINDPEAYLVSRLGGDEFTFLLTDLSRPEDASRIAERALEKLSEPLSLEGHEVYLSASIGIAIAPNDGANANTLLKNADTAMYQAKDCGKNDFRFFEQGMHENALKRLKLEGMLRMALANSEFKLFYQPQFETCTGKLTGAEALIRWQPPGKELISPGSFIPLAEETGLIVEIGEWVLREACTQQRKWIAAGFPAVPMSVNVSGRQFEDIGFVKKIEGILEETGAAANQLLLEITESTLMKNTSILENTLSQLRSLGLKLAIDDFGTGYSSLAYLKRFPLYCIKIDRAFINNIHSSSDDRSIVNAIVAMAHSLKLKVLAEGVETQEQKTTLIDLSCNEMQGYLSGHPMPPEDFSRNFLTC